MKAMQINNYKLHISILIILLFFFPGCMRFALRLSPDLIPDLTASFFEECDLNLAEQSIPSSLKLLEGLLKSDPENSNVLSSLCMGFCGYSLFFVEDKDPARASDLYLRARNYGLKALDLDGDHIGSNNRILRRIGNFGASKLEALMWTTVSWNAWINLNLDKPAALAQLRIAQDCLNRLLEIDPEYQYGLPYILMGTTLSALPPMLGGDSQKARVYFQKALNSGNRRFFLAQFYYAKYYAVRIQDRELFESLIDEIIQGDPKALSNVCLINAVIRDKAIKLKEEVDDLFI
jgi:tetratricopeptide (TPR) repeat protein